MLKNLKFPGMTLILAVLAMTTLRMKCFWGPYICIFAAVMVAHKDIWTAIAKKLGSSNNEPPRDNGNRSGGSRDSSNWKMVFFMRHIMMAFVMIILYNSFKEGINKELENLR